MWTVTIHVLNITKKQKNNDNQQQWWSTHYKSTLYINDIWSHTLVTFGNLYCQPQKEHVRCVAYVPAQIWSRGLKSSMITLYKRTNWLINIYNFLDMLKQKHTGICDL